MVDKVAGLTLGVDVSQVDQATKSLKNFKQANQEVTGALEDVALAQSISNAKLKEQQQEQRRAAKETESLRREFQNVQKAIDPISGKLNNLADASAKLDRMWEKGIVDDKEFFRLGNVIEQTTNKLKAAQFAATEEGQAAALAATQKAAAIKQAASAAAAEAAAQEKAAQSGAKFLASLQGQVDAMGKTSAELLAMRAAQLGVADQAAPLISALNTQSKQMNAAGISAGQYRNAMRLLPAQITDVVTSLAGGMPIWLVAIQQGGQIKDSFGGIGNTFKVLLSYLNPVTVGMGALGVALAAVAKATYDAYEGNQKLNEALVLTGNYAASTTGEFNKMLDSIQSATGATSGSMKDIATQLAASGKYTLSQIKEITRVTADWAQQTGAKTSEVIGYFDKITKDPVKGLASLNEQYNFLEKGQLTYISNLEKTQGKTVAANAATKIFADTMETRLGKLADSASPLEKMWTNIKQWASDTWDYVGQRTLGALNLLTDVFAGTMEQIQFLINKGDELLGNFVVSTAEKLSKLPGAGNFFQGIADGQREVVAQAQKDNIALAKSIDERNERIKKGEMGYVQAAKEAGDKASQYSQKTKDAVSKEAEELAKKNKQQKVTVDQGDKISEQYQADIIALQAQLSVLKNHQSVNDQISQQRKTLWNEQAKFQVLEEASKTRTLTKQEKQYLAQKKTILAYGEQKAELGDAIQKQETLNKLHDQSTKSIQQSTAAIKQMQDQAGLGDKAAQRAKELQAMTDAYTNSGGSAGDSKLQEQIAKRKEFYDAQDKMQTDFLSGAESAWNSWGESVNNVYGNVKSFAGDALNGLSTQLTDFLTTGKASFGDFAKSIITDIVNMTVKMAIFNSLSAAFGGGSAFSFAGALGGKANGGVVGNTFSGGGFTGQGGKYDPAGTVHRGEFVFTKEATQRIGVANLYRQMRGYANGGAVGQSGVSGGGSAPGVAIGIGDINVNAGSGDMNAQGLSQGIRQIVTQMLVTECSQGGQIFKLIKGGA